MKMKRKSGILMHPTSLPGHGGIGTLGEETRKFLKFLHEAGQSLWQVLPLGPTAYGNSPYSCYSAFAGNPLLIDLNSVAADGDLEEPVQPQLASEDRVDYAAVAAWKYPLLSRAAQRFIEASDSHHLQDFEDFCADNVWLEDYALFMALKEHFEGAGWSDWPEEIARRLPSAIAEYTDKLRTSILVQKYMQWQFFRQWREVKRFANDLGIDIFGDIPIFVAYDSADVWVHREIFKLDERGLPLVVAGVPPDYFSETGQLWGNPVYDWDAIAADGYSWWIQRLRSSLQLYDLVRIDHFRGFAAYWEVAATEETAINGRWVTGPGEKLFNAVSNALGEPLPIIAEDLGLITPDVEKLLDTCGFPGMKVLHFAFGSGSDNYYLPHNYSPQCVVYTGTHDNNTTRGWFNEVGENERQHAMSYLRCSPQEIVWEMIRAAYSSVAAYAVIPVQDLFSLDSGARMNTPGLSQGNWEWRLPPGLLWNFQLAEELKAITSFYNRLA
ncbi:4-alpha-glucanotransferase [Geobacter sp. DSM 9736]|nr:4-alpha-glucanotransferase [Geobacter sp. DSM 9736]